MPDQYHTLPQLNILFQAVLLRMLGYEKTGSPADYSREAYAAVRVAWPTYGAPAWKVTEDVAFIQVSEDDDPINRQRETKLTTVGEFVLDEATSYTRVVNLMAIFYGPNSFDNAQLLRDGVFKDEYRFILNKERIYPIPDIVSPRRAPEAFQSQWWERTDIELRFNEKITKTDEISAIESADIILVTSDSRQEREITVE